MREIVLDTETTGLDPESGDRIVEIACLEMMRRIPTGRVWHHYFNPERDMPQAAFAVHGLSAAFLADKPKFDRLAASFMEFVAGAHLIIHNAAFDVKFLNAELKRAGLAPIAPEWVICSLAIARRKHAGAQNNLDALCRRYSIDNSARVKHGAMLDVDLLAEVYLNLIDARQPGFDLSRAAGAANGAGSVLKPAAPRPRPLPARLTEGEREAHAAFIQSFRGGTLWSAYE